MCDPLYGTVSGKPGVLDLFPAIVLLPFNEPEFRAVAILVRCRSVAMSKLTDRPDKVKIDRQYLQTAQAK
jgi:hypothetical protein